MALLHARDLSLSQSLPNSFSRVACQWTAFFELVQPTLALILRGRPDWAPEGFRFQIQKQGLTNRPRSAGAMRHQRYRQTSQVHRHVESMHRSLVSAEVRALH